MDYLIIKAEESQVIAARFEFSGRSAALGGAASFVRDAENPLSVIVQRIAEGVVGSPRVVLCLASSLFAQRVVELPLTDIKKVREVLPTCLQGEMVLPSEDVVFDALPSADGRFLAIWAKKAEIAHAVEIFKTAGIEPHVITADTFSWSFLPAIPPDVVICDGNTVAVMTQGRLSFMRALEPGSSGVQVSAMLSALEDSGMILPSRIIVFGELADTPVTTDMPRLTVDRLELPPELALMFRTDAAFQQLVGLYAVARGCHAGTLPDFRRGELAWTAGDAKHRRKLFLTTILAAIAVMLLFVSKGLQYRAVQADITSLDKSISSLYREIFPSRIKAVDELAEIRGEIKKMAGAENSRGILDVFRFLSEAKGTTINGLYEVELEGRTLRLKGDASSARAVSDFKAAIAPLMTSIELGEVKSRPDGSVSFSLSGTIKEAIK